MEVLDVLTGLTLEVFRWVDHIGKIDAILNFNNPRILSTKTTKPAVVP